MPIEPPQYPFAMPEDRPSITLEPEPPGCHTTPLFPGMDWIGRAQQGGGYVPADYEWPTNPKQRQEEESAG